MSISRPPAGAETDYEELAKAFDRRYSRMGGSVFNGSTKFVNAILSILTLLVVAAICGEVVVYGQVQSLESKVDLIVDGHLK